MIVPLSRRSFSVEEFFFALVLLRGFRIGSVTEVSAYNGLRPGDIFGNPVACPGGISPNSARQKSPGYANPVPSFGNMP